jgi:hypothetical protein
MRKSIYKAAQSILLMVGLFTTGIIFPVHSQQNQPIPRKPVIITLGQPSIWSLEQAHYLLARMRRESIDLQSKSPTADDLDPNAVSGSRLNQLKTLFDVGVGYDASMGFNNNLLARNSQYNLERKQSLDARRDQLYQDLDKVTGELSTLKYQREKMNGDGSDEVAKKLKDTEIEAKTAEQGVIRERITQTSGEIDKITAPSGQMTSPTPPNAPGKEQLPDSVLEKLVGEQAQALKDLVKKDPRLSATAVLDNHIQMQYELIAKQLTLLRDEVGPGERLVFLELPHSIYTTPGKAEEKLAQVWWHIDGYVRVDETAKRLTDLEETRAKLKALLFASRRGEYERLSKDIDIKIAEIKNSQLDHLVEQSQRIIQGGAENQAKLLQEISLIGDQIKPTTGMEFISTDGMNSKLNKAQYKIRTVDLIPRQSSLNVNDIQDTVKSNNFAGFFTTLFGLGAKVSYQRQQQLYEQYLHQDVFASGFGKGEDNFGWTFGPLPGTKRLAPGLRTTYAVLVIPEDAQAIQLTARGCYFPRKSEAPQNFSDTQSQDWTDGRRVSQYQCDPNGSSFTLAVPGARGDNFWLTGLKYRRVRPGERNVVFLQGDDFSTQTGVLVDGASLSRSIGVAQPELETKDKGGESAGDNKITGYYELVNSKQMVIVFTMPKAYQGTPTISLVAPGRGRVINDLRLNINGEESKRLDEMPPMIAPDVDAPALSLDKLDVFHSTPGQSVTAYLTGTKFQEGKDLIYVNTREITNKTLKASGLYQLTFDVNPDEENLSFTIVQGKEFSTKTFPNPLLLKITQAGVLSNEMSKKDRIITLKLEGSGFNATLVPSVDGAKIRDIRYISSSQIILVVTAPKDFMVVTLTSAASNKSASIIIPTPAPPEATEQAEQPQKKGKPKTGVESNSENQH